MAAINKGTECFVGLPGEHFIYETTDFLTDKKRLQTFYGDLGGANEPPRDKIYQIGDSLGLALGEVLLENGVEYQLINCKVTVRESGGLFGWGNGQYKEEFRPVYVESKIIIIDSVRASELKNNRLNQKNQEQDDLLKKLTDEAPTTGNINASSSSSFNLTTIVLIVFGFLTLTIGGVLWWKGRQDKKIKN